LSLTSANQKHTTLASLGINFCPEELNFAAKKKNPKVALALQQRWRWTCDGIVGQESVRALLEGIGRTAGTRLTQAAHCFALALSHGHKAAAAHQLRARSGTEPILAHARTHNFAN